MITAWELYLWTRLDMVESICIGIGMVCVLSIIACAVVYIETLSVMSIWDDNSSYDVKKRKNASTRQLIVRRSIKYICVLFVFWFFFALIPSKKEAAMIWIVPQLATVENADLLQGEAAEIYKLAKDALKESIGVEEKE